MREIKRVFCITWPTEMNYGQSDHGSSFIHTYEAVLSGKTCYEIN